MEGGMMEIKNLEQATTHFKDTLKEKTVRTERRSYAVFIETESGKKYCVCYKRDYYKNFQYHFPNLGKVGWGQIANKDLLLGCLGEGAKYISVMPDGKIYAIEPSFWLSYYERFHTDVPHLKGEIAIPLKFFTRFDDF
jgi:hypothetical protein